MKNPLTRGRAAALAFALVAGILATPAIGATDVTDIGSLDQAQLATLPPFQAARKQLDDYAASLRTSYTNRAKHASQAEQQRLVGEYQQKMGDKQNQLLGPLFAKARAAIASVASSKNLSVVVDKRIVVFGGTDITGNVKDLLSGPGDPVPPRSSPPPSSVGFVDQVAIDQTPKVKAATADFQKFQADQQKAAQDKLKSAKTDADRDAVLKDYRKILEDRQNATLKPVVDSTRAAISDVAKSKGLILVIDKGNIVYGGTDITSEVTTKLK